MRCDLDALFTRPVSWRHEGFIVAEDGVLQLSSRFAGLELVELIFVHMRRLVGEKQESRHEILSEVVV